MVDGRCCCSPARGANDAGVVRPDLGAGDGPPARVERVELVGGEFLMGTADEEGFPADGEGPVRGVTLLPFAIDVTAVTNEAFGGFVAATGYRTETEEWGWSFVFAAFLPGRLRAKASRPPATPWWCAVDGADWRHPEGPGSDLEDRADHPVVHLSWRDAAAYCAWAGGRLPTEAEWEYAARGGLVQQRYPWGDELTPDGEHRCNIWQGVFPTKNTVADGYRGTAPVRSFPPNGFGLYEVAGNVWEWVEDWFSTDHLATPAMASTGTTRVMRGGSYLCHSSYCNRYRVAARSHNNPDSASGNTGFRCAYNLNGT